MPSYYYFSYKYYDSFNFSNCLKKKWTYSGEGVTVGVGVGVEVAAHAENPNTVPFEDNS
jgi:hypothetical protein